MTYENRTTNGRALNDHGYGIEFYGTDGTLFVDRAGFELTPETGGTATRWWPARWGVGRPQRRTTRATRATSSTA